MPYLAMLADPLWFAGGLFHQTYKAENWGWKSRIFEWQNYTVSYRCKIFCHRFIFVAFLLFLQWLKSKISFSFEDFQSAFGKYPEVEGSQHLKCSFLMFIGHLHFYIPCQRLRLLKLSCPCVGGFVRATLCTPQQDYVVHHPSALWPTDLRCAPWCTRETYVRISVFHNEHAN